MTVRVYLDLDRLHFLVAGQRHRARLAHVPTPGERLVLLCGLADTVVYTDAPTRAAETCWLCDLKYRRGLGLPIPPNHPGLQQAAPKPSPSPRRRSYTK